MLYNLKIYLSFLSYNIIIYKNRNIIPNVLKQQNAYVSKYHCALEQEEPML